jgi:acetyltransferase-like isoleucine patch superfamily enzyme
MHMWHKIRNPWRASFNFAIFWACRCIPFLGVKRALYRLCGMRVGRGAAVGLGAMFDIFFPDLITLGEDCLIGYNCTVLTHEFLIDEWRTGLVDIGRRVVIGANTTVLAGVSIGDGATISACSLVNRDIPAGALAGGIPVRVITPGANGANGANGAGANGADANGTDANGADANGTDANGAAAARSDGGR